MADKKKLLSGKIKNEELTDEQANEATGGAKRPTPRVVTLGAKCDVCNSFVYKYQLTYTYFEGALCNVCDKCLKSK